MDLSAYGLVPLTIKDKPLIDGILNRQDTMLSAYSFTSHYIWRDHFNFHWGIINGYLCLIAQYEDYVYMPVPPVSTEKPDSNPPLPPFSKGGMTEFPPLQKGDKGGFAHYLFNIMDIINNNKSVSRIENIDESRIESFIAAGHKVKPGEPEYVYLREDLSNLKGNPYKSKRAMCNYFVKHYQYKYEPFEAGHVEQCIELYGIWREEKTKRISDALYKAMIEDSFTVHREVINNHRLLGITGRVVKINDRVEGYIFGFERNNDICYILMEVTNPGIKGLAQFIFREFCKELKGYTYINALGDSGLENLRNVKLSYRPFRLVPAFTAYRD